MFDDGTNAVKGVKGMGPFTQLGLCDDLVQVVKHKLLFRKPTPIQRKLVPLILDKKNVIATANTGSGKTMAFLLPLIQMLDAHCQRFGARALIILPTRELAVQTVSEMTKCGLVDTAKKSAAKGTTKLSVVRDPRALRFTLLVSGDTGGHLEQLTAINCFPDLIVGTPGTILTVTLTGEKLGSSLLKRVKTVVFDEGDQLLDPQLRPTTETICDYVKGAQKVALSATMPEVLLDFARIRIKNPVRVAVETSIPAKMDLQFIRCLTEDHLSVLVVLLRDILPRRFTTKKKPKSGFKIIVFTDSQKHVDFLKNLFLVAMKGSPVGFVGLLGLAGKMHHDEREKALEAFRKGQRAILFTTDVGSRGMDIENVDAVVNFNFPRRQPALFIHRAGRTARAGKKGVCISLVLRDDMRYLANLLPYLHRDIVSASSGDVLPGTKDHSGKLERAVIGTAEPSDVQLERAWLKKVLESGRVYDAATSTELQDLHKSMTVATTAAFNDKVDKAAVNLSTSWQDINFGVSPVMKNEAISDETRVGRNNIVQGLKAIRGHDLRTNTKGKLSKTNSITLNASAAMQSVMNSGDLDSFAWNGKRGRAGKMATLAEKLRSKKDIERSSPNWVETILEKRNRRKAEHSIMGLSRGDANAKLSEVERDIVAAAESDTVTVTDLLTGDDSFQSIVADDEENLKKQKGVMRWDPVRKRFVVMRFTAEGQRLKRKDQFGNIKGAMSPADRAEHWAKEFKHKAHRGTTKRSGEVEDINAIKEATEVEGYAKRRVKEQGLRDVQEIEAVWKRRQISSAHKKKKRDMASEKTRKKRGGYVGGASAPTGIKLGGRFRAGVKEVSKHGKTKQFRHGKEVLNHNRK